MLLHSYAGRLIYWSRQLDDRYHEHPEDDFSRELRVEVAVRMVETEWLAFNAAAPRGSRWSLQTGLMEGIPDGQIGILLERVEAKARAELGDIECRAALAVHRRMRLSPGQAAVLQSSAFGVPIVGPCKTYLRSLRCRSWQKNHSTLSFARAKASRVTTPCRSRTN